MIVVDFPEPTEGFLKLKVSGHAGKSARGYDIVCSAVSTLTQTLAGGIQNGLEAEVSGRLDSGDTELLIRVEPENSEALKLVCKVFRFGFQKISESYPEHVKMI